MEGSTLSHPQSASQHHFLSATACSQLTMTFTVGSAALSSVAIRKRCPSAAALYRNGLAPGRRFGAIKLNNFSGLPILRPPDADCTDTAMRAKRPVPPGKTVLSSPAASAVVNPRGSLASISPVLL